MATLARKHATRRSRNKAKSDKRAEDIAWKRVQYDVMLGEIGSGTFRRSVKYYAELITEFPPVRLWGHQTVTAIKSYGTTLLEAVSSQCRGPLFLVSTPNTFHPAVHPLQVRTFHQSLVELHEPLVVSTCIVESKFRLAWRVFMDLVSSQGIHCWLSGPSIGDQADHDGCYMPSAGWVLIKTGGDGVNTITPDGDSFEFQSTTNGRQHRQPTAGLVTARALVTTAARVELPNRGLSTRICRADAPDEGPEMEEELRGEVCSTKRSAAGFVRNLLVLPGTFLAIQVRTNTTTTPPPPYHHRLSPSTTRSRRAMPTSAHRAGSGREATWITVREAPCSLPD